MKINKFLIGTVAGAAMLMASMTPAFADSYSTNFDNFNLGSISGQMGWSNAVNPSIDQAIVANTTGIKSFGTKSFRMSDAFTDGAFGDWVFAKPLTNAVGEVDSTDGTFSPGILQRHFEMQFDITSASPDAQQPGLHVSVSPDRGDGSRMSYLRFQDDPAGIGVYFDDVTDAGPVGTTAMFNESLIATLDRTKSHAIKLTLDTLDGPGNDVVKVWIDGVLKETGTSWENYYRYDPEAAGEQSPRIVKTVIFQSRTGSGPITNPADQGKGFLFDNFSMSSGPMAPTTFAQCKNNGWKLFNDPMFRNEGFCVAYVATHMHTITGNVTVKTGGISNHVVFEMNSALNNGTGVAFNLFGGLYHASISDVVVNGNHAWFAGKITQSTTPFLNGKWFFAEVEDNPDMIWVEVEPNQAQADTAVAAMNTPSGSLTITGGNITIH